MVHARSSRRSRPSFRPSQPRTRASSLSSNSSSNSSNSSSSSSSSRTNTLDTTWTDTIGGVTIHLSKLGLSNSPKSKQTYPHCAAWKADMKVYLDAKGMGDYIRPSTDADNFTYIEEEVLAKMDRERKAMIWFSVEEGLRKEHLLDLCERDKTSEDVWRRIHERFGGGKEYEPLPELCIDEEM